MEIKGTKAASKHNHLAIEGDLFPVRAERASLELLELHSDWYKRTIEIGNVDTTRSFHRYSDEEWSRIRQHQYLCHDIAVIRQNKSGGFEVLVSVRSRTDEIKASIERESSQSSDELLSALSMNGPKAFSKSAIEGWRWIAGGRNLFNCDPERAKNYQSLERGDIDSLFKVLNRETGISVVDCKSLHVLGLGITNFPTEDLFTDRFEKYGVSDRLIDPQKTIQGIYGVIVSGSVQLKENSLEKSEWVSLERFLQTKDQYCDYMQQLLCAVLDPQKSRFN